MQMTRGVTWDSVTWTVVDRSETEPLKHSCEKQCEEDLKMFSFKVNVLGLRYWVEMEKEGEVLRCSSMLFSLGISTCARLKTPHPEDS